VDPVDDQIADLEDGLREEFVDGRTVELGSALGGLGDQGCRSFSKQRWLQLRGIGVDRGNDGR